MNGALEQGDEVHILSDRKYLVRFLLRPLIFMGVGLAVGALCVLYPRDRFCGYMLILPALLLINGWVAVSILLRMHSQRPALILTPEGIVDKSSSVSSGVGLIPWEKIGAITLAYRGASGRYFNFPHDWFVVIIPRDPATFHARPTPAGAMTRFCLRMVQWRPRALCIPDFVLAPRPSESLECIQEYLHTHARHHHHITIPPFDRHSVLEALKRQRG